MDSFIALFDAKWTEDKNGFVRSNITSEPSVVDDNVSLIFPAQSVPRIPNGTLPSRSVSTIAQIAVNAFPPPSAIVAILSAMVPLLSIKDSLDVKETVTVSPTFAQVGSAFVDKMVTGLKVGMVRSKMTCVASLVSITSSPGFPSCPV